METTFDIQSAERIARAVRFVEGQFPPAKPLQFQPFFPAKRDGGSDAVRLCKTTAVWEPGTVATLDIWEEGATPGETQSTGETITATNHSYRVAAGVLVVVAKAKNGVWYLVEAADPEATDGGEGGEGGEGGSCYSASIGGADLTGLPGYDAAKKQALTHDNGCMKWIDIEDCP